MFASFQAAQLPVPYCAWKHAASHAGVLAHLPRCVSRFLERKKKLTKLQGGESCLKWGCFFMLPPLNCICHYKLRRDIKSDHGIDQGGCIRDALAVTFCFCCALIQVRFFGVQRQDFTFWHNAFSGNEATTTWLIVLSPFPTTTQ